MRAGLNHKMGQSDTTNTLLNFGEGGGCLGYLIEGGNEGLKNMFHMMNKARIRMGMPATMSGLGGYLCSLHEGRRLSVFLPLPVATGIGKVSVRSRPGPVGARNRGELGC